MSGVPVTLPEPPAVTAPTYWLPASSAVYRLAFGATGTPTFRNHEWGVPPDPWAVEALAARAAGVPWRPAKPPPSPAYGYRKTVRRLMREREAVRPGDGNPATLLREAHEVMAFHEAWVSALASGEDRLTAAARDGTVRARGVLVDTPHTPPPGLGNYVDVSPVLLAAADRVIRANGMLCWRGKDVHDFGPHGAGPYYAGVQVDAAGLHALCPPKPFPAADWASPWDLILWRALGAVAVHNIGSRPDSVNEPHQALSRTWDRHAMRTGAWAAIEAAERELKGLSASGKAVACGCRPSQDASGHPLPHAAGLNVRIPPEVFLDSHLRFNALGSLGEFDRRAAMHAHAARFSGQPVPVQESYFEVQVEVAGVAEAWGMFRAVAVEPVPEPKPFPPNEHMSAWLAATWRAFGTWDAPGHIVQRRSFDDGTVRLPEETEARHKVRLEQHQRFDAAEQEIFGLLANDRTKAKGQRPALAASGKRLHTPAPEHVNVPASTFLSQNIALDPHGCLSARMPSLERLFPPFHLRASEADPDFPLYYDLLIEAAGLRQAWGLSPDGEVIAPPAFPKGASATVSNSTRFWTATQALTWMAFGTPQTIQERDALDEEYHRRWRCNPPDDVLALLTARAAPHPHYPWHVVTTADMPLQPGRPPDFTSPFTSPKGPALARAIRGDHRRALGRLVSYGELAQMLRAEMAERDQQRTMLDDASQALWGAIWDGIATAWGVPSATPSAVHEELPRTLGLVKLRFRRDATEPGDANTVEEWAEARSKPKFHSVRFDRVQVEKSGLRRTEPPGVENVLTTQTGVAGRPTSRHLVEPEFERRIANCGLEVTVGAEARVLADWLLRTHPQAAPMTAGTIETLIRARFRQHKRSTK